MVVSDYGHITLSLRIKYTLIERKLKQNTLLKKNYVQDLAIHV